MSTIVTRTGVGGKGSPLTNTELDANFTNLNADKLQLGQTFSGGTANAAIYLDGSKQLVSGALPASAGGTGLTALSSGIATFLGAASSANLAAAMTDETGSGSLVFGTSPTLTTPTITGGTTNPTTLQENSSPAVVQSDIGTAPNEIPLNQYLGSAAYVDQDQFWNTQSATGFRNVVINGGFDVWQRSAGPVTGADYTTVDRWQWPSSGMTSQRVANDRTTTIPYALQVTADSGGYGLSVQRIEDVRTLSGGYATLSFWAKSSAAGVFRLQIFQGFGSGGSTSLDVIDNASYFNMAAANTWQRFTVTVYMPSVAGKTIGTGSYVQIGIGPGSGTAGRVFTYSEVQFEAGTVATPFERRPYATELQLCQRYFQLLGKYTGNSPLLTGSGIVRSGFLYLAYAPHQFVVPMRAAPTIAQGGALVAIRFNGAGYGVDSVLSSTGISIENPSPRGCSVRIEKSSGSWSTGDIVSLCDGDGTGFISLNAEL